MIKPYYNEFERMHIKHETFTGLILKAKKRFLYFRKSILNTSIDIKIRSTAHRKFYEG